MRNKGLRKSKMGSIYGKKNDGITKFIIAINIDVLRKQYKQV